ESITALQGEHQTCTGRGSGPTSRGQQDAESRESIRAPDLSWESIRRASELSRESTRSVLGKHQAPQVGGSSTQSPGRASGEHLSCSGRAPDLSRESI
ncbi:hypothetical protein NDU88_000455, partial [Pleurodeles waltl]